MIEPLVWKQRCRNDKTAVADRKIWGTKCGKYRITYSHIRYGEGILSDKWYAEELDNNGHTWEIISKHEKKDTAQKACEKRHRKKERDAAKLERLEKGKRTRKKRAKKRKVTRKN
jgi:hypothetical protein